MTISIDATSVSGIVTIIGVLTPAVISVINALKAGRRDSRTVDVQTKVNEIHQAVAPATVVVPPVPPILNGD